MNRFFTEFKVGLFTIVSVVAIIYMFFVLTPESFKNNSTKLYHTIVDNASGVVVKTQVKTNGVTIGKVKSISLMINQTKIDLEIDASVKIPQGSKVAITEKGLLGDVFVDIVRTADSGLYQEEGAYLPPVENQVSITALMGVANSIGADVKRVTQTLSKVFGGNEGVSKIETSFSNLKESLSLLKLLIEENKSQVSHTVKNFKVISESIKNITNSKEKDLTDIISDMKETIANFKDFSKSAKNLFVDINKDKIESIMAKLDETANSLNAITHKLEKGEGTIGRLIHDESTIDKIEETLGSVNQFISPAKKLKIMVDYHGELRSNDMTQHYFNLKLQSRPDKFYLLGATNLNYAEAEKTETTETIGNVTKTSEQIKLEKSIRLNLQIAKRWNHIQLRFGLFESTGGLGADFFIFKDNLKLTLEAFDWDQKSSLRKNLHLKSFLSFTFLNNLSLMFGVDDITRYDNSVSKNINSKPNWFFGAGLQFSDKEMKSVVGISAFSF